MIHSRFVLGFVCALFAITALTWAVMSEQAVSASPLLGFTPTFTPPPTNTPTATPTSTATPPPEPTSPPPVSTPVSGDNTPTPAAPTDTPTAWPLLPQTGGSMTMSPLLWVGAALLGGGLLFHLIPARQRNR